MKTSRSRTRTTSRRNDTKHASTKPHKGVKRKNTNDPIETTEKTPGKMAAEQEVLAARKNAHPAHADEY